MKEHDRSMREMGKHLLAIAAMFAFVIACCSCAAQPGSSSSAGDQDAITSASASADASANTSAATETSASASASAAASSAAAASADAGASSAATGELAGKPWVTSIVQGNLPPEQPAAKDDLYTHYNYDYLSAHQEQSSTAMQEHQTELKTTILAAIKDSSKSNHDLDQMRILYEQAADFEKLKEIGYTEVKPYFDRINAVTTIEEMNTLLSSDDFPFSPFVLASLTTNDTRDVNIVAVTANLALVDALLIGGTYYQDTDDPQKAQSMDAAIQNLGVSTMMDLMAAGMERDVAIESFGKIKDFEKAHGKYVDYTGKYLTKDFGAAAQAARESYCTLEELCAMCSNFPMKETLDKLGKGASPRYSVMREWAETFNGMWTNENLDVIKLIAKVKILAETRPYRDPTSLNELSALLGMPVTDAETFAYGACNKQNTFAIVLAKTYVEEALGPNAKSRLTELSQELVDTYKDSVANTPWVGAESQQRIIEKLDCMTLNVLEPVGGYYDFSGIELTPTSEGGTLFGNYLKLRQYRLDQESKMVGQPAAANIPWFMMEPTTPNAFYDPWSNSINILPGFVTSLFYADDMSETDLLAGIGFVVGHEISHAFDYLGSQFDAYGTPTPVLAEADVDAFVLKVTTLASYYKELEIAPDIMVNGENVVTEAASDLCGMQAALALVDKAEDADYEKFFARCANVWAQAVPSSMMPNLLLDNHTLNNHRINVNAQMFDPMYTTFGVTEGDGMYLAPEKRIIIWGPKA